MSNQTLISTAEFEHIYEKWNKKVYQYALNKTSSTYIAEETVQRVFIKLWNNLFHKHISVDIEAQLFCIARTTLFDIVKEERKRQVSVDLKIKADAVPTPSDLYLLKEIQLRYEEIVARMPESRRKVFMMSRFDHLSYKEIAERLSITPKTVENHIALALKALKKIFLLFIFYLKYFWG